MNGSGKLVVEAARIPKNSVVLIVHGACEKSENFSASSDSLPATCVELEGKNFLPEELSLHSQGMEQELFNVSDLPRAL